MNRRRSKALSLSLVLLGCVTAGVAAAQAPPPVPAKAGVAVGTHVEVLDWRTSGRPPASTRVLPVIHCPVAQGPLPEGGGGIEQPETVYGAEVVTTA